MKGRGRDSVLFPQLRRWGHSSPGKCLGYSALLAIAIAGTWCLVRAVDWFQVRQAVLGADHLLLGAATIAAISTYLLRAYRWRALLAPLAPARLKNLFAATVIGFSAAFLLGRAGEVTRPLVLPLRERSVQLGDSVLTVVVERLLDLAAVALIVAIDLLWFTPAAMSESSLARMRCGGLVLLIAIGFCFGLIAFFNRRDVKLAAWFEGRCSRPGSLLRHAQRPLVRVLSQADDALSILADRRQVLVLALWTAAVWASIVVTAWLIIRAFGLEFGLAQTLFVLCWGTLGSLVPTPGGAAGAYHAATTTGLVLLGSTIEQGTGISIMTHLVTFAPALAFGAYYFVRGDVNFRYLRGGATRAPRTCSMAPPSRIRLAEE